MQDQEERAIDALVSAGEVLEPWGAPIQAVATALGLSAGQARGLVEDMCHRKLIHFTLTRGTFRVNADPSPAYRWKKGAREGK